MMGCRKPPQDGIFVYNISLKDRVRKNHPLRKIKENIGFVYDEVKDTYGTTGNVSTPPPVILKMMVLLFFYNVRSERELMETIPERLDWLWFLGYRIDSPVPDHSVLSKARKRWGEEIFKNFFERIVIQCVNAGLVDGTKIFMDSSLIDANASNNSVIDTRSLQKYLHEGYHELEERINNPVASYRVWSLDISLSSVRICHHVFRNVVLQGIGTRCVIDFLSEPGNEIECRRSVGLFPPFRQRNKVMSAAGTELFQPRKKQEAVTGDGECRLSGNRLGRPDLSVADAYSVFLLPMIHLDLPPVKIALQQGPSIAFKVGAQKIGRVMVVLSGVHRGSVGLRGDHQQTQEAASRPSLPQDVADLFVSDVAPRTSEMNLARLPGNRVVLSDSFGRKPFFAVYTPSFPERRKAQSCVLPTTANNVYARERLQKDGAIAQTAVNSNDHLSCFCSKTVEFVSEPLHDFKSLLREVMYLDRLFVLRSRFVCRLLPRLFDRRTFYETDRISSGREVALTVMGEDQRRMHKPETIEEVDMERRRERIPLPEGRRDLPTALFVSLSAFLRRIVVPPESSPWFKAVVQDIASKYEVACPIRNSSISKQPMTEQAAGANRGPVEPLRLSSVLVLATVNPPSFLTISTPSLPT